MFYIQNNGRKRTPMHIMNAESVHSLGHGGKIVTSILNHEGLALSYPELRRYYDLATYVAHENREQIALPAQFVPEKFTSGAIHNWDHEGAYVSEHDTVTVLFQDQAPSLHLKPRISETDVKHSPQSFKETLPCLVLMEFHMCAQQPALPESYKVDGNVFKLEEALTGRIKDMAWSLA